MYNTYNILYWCFFCSLQVERGSPKSCFLFLGSVLCRVNWVSVLSDAWNPSPLPETQSMVVSLLFMMILLAKEAQLVDQTVSLGSCDQLWLLSVLFSPDDVFLTDISIRCSVSELCLQPPAYFIGQPLV